MKRIARVLFLSLMFSVPFMLSVLAVTKIRGNQERIDTGSITDSYDDSKLWGTFHGSKSAIPPKDLYEKYADKNISADIDVNILGSKTQKKEKRIEIDLSKQKLYAYEGDKKKYSFSVSTGKWWPTPTGDFRIWTKLKYTTMTGGSKALGTYYNLPNVPYTMYFYNSNVAKWQGFGIHGAYWHNNFGHPMSHGCVNMKPEEAKVIFDWAKSENQNGEGTKIKIYGSTPNN